MPTTLATCGADSTDLVRQPVIDAFRSQYAASPAFWGRYFKAPANPDDIQYKYKKENRVLHENNIKLLPIARQTSRVAGSEAEGRTDGTHNAAAVIEAFGAPFLVQAGVAPLVFLDTEPEGTGPALSFDYYVGWARGLIAEGKRQTGGRLQFQPGIYLNSSGHEGNGRVAAHVAAHVLALIQSNQLEGELQCRAIWSAKYGDRTPLSPIPAWADQETRLPEMPATCPVIAWQWAEAKDNIPRLPIDPNLLHPSAGAEFLTHLLVPPLPPSLFSRVLRWFRPSA